MFAASPFFMDLEPLAASIRKSHDALREKARTMQEMKLAVQKQPLNLSVCAVDGGLLYHRMHGADIAVSRAVAVNFTYLDGKPSEHKYHPSRSPEPSVEIKTSLDEHEANLFRSLVRLKYEIQCANEALEKFKPDLLLLDGSLLPVPSDIPAKSSQLRPLYDGILESYKKLYSQECLFCGVIKDSRARRLSPDCSDSLLCNYLLSEGERTREFSYFEKPPSDKDLGILGADVKVTYIKPSENDIPLRVEILGDVEKTSSYVLGLSAISKHFAYPAALVEADMCAALDPVELESIERQLQTKAGIMPLRRNSRPFR
jgi:hypothetical protein